MAVVVDVTNFITVSSASKEAYKTASLLKTLNVNALILGEVGVGKKSLAHYILPDASIIDASNFDEILLALESSKEIIISNIETSPNIIRIIDTIVKNSVRVVATMKGSLNNQFIDEFFSVKFSIPPLRERMDDVPALIGKFINEASTLFTLDYKFNISDFNPNIEENSTSLRRQVILHYLLQDIKDSELMDIIENFLFDKLGSNSDYRNFLYIYEVPLIKAGLKKFKSQLQLSDKLGLNRNTLRKKISDSKQYL